MVRIQTNRFMKFGLICVLILGVMVVGLLGNHRRALAQDGGQTFIVQAGGFGPANAELYAFAPTSLKVHRGDTVMWHFNSFHNVHLGEDSPTDFVIAPEVDGQPVPQINPQVAFANVETGAVYSGGSVTSGLPIDPSAPPVFSLVIDLEPGTYLYFCDVHPGMVGNIVVVPDDEVIPSPTEVEAAAQAEVDSQYGTAGAALEQLSQSAPTMAEDGNLNISAGSGDTGRVSAEAFFTPLAVIQTGESVTWTVPQDSVEAHTVASVNFTGEEFLVTPGENGPPIIGLGPVFFPMADSGVSVGTGDSFNSGLLEPGQSYTVNFNDPGVYAYLCRIYPGMAGVVVVQSST